MGNRRAMKSIRWQPWERHQKAGQGAKRTTEQAGGVAGSAIAQQGCKTGLNGPSGCQRRSLMNRGASFSNGVLNSSSASFHKSNW